MTPRDFICTPSSWVTDPRLNSLSEDTELLFRRLASCTDAKWRFPLDPGDPEHCVRAAVCSPKRRFRAWSPNRIRRSLNELTASGMLTRHNQGDRCWLEVATAYRYEKGRDPMGIEKTASVQPDLPGVETVENPPELIVMPPPEAFPAKPPRGNVNNSGEIGVREDKKKSKTPESARREAHAPPAVVADESRNQELCSGKESGRFARGPADDTDPLWKRLCNIVGLLEMYQCGDLWLKRMKLCRDALSTAVSDWERLTPEVKKRYPKPATYVTDAFQREKRKFA